MAHRFEKNYYAVLGVRKDATTHELRRAYRDLAKKFHPDVAQDNPFAETHFATISEAYEILSNPDSRRAYDEERWLRGHDTRSKAARSITPEWIRAESLRLREHMRSIDTYRMNHAALREYVEALLSDEHLSVLQKEPGIRKLIFSDILTSIEGINYRHIPAIMEQLQRLAADDTMLLQKAQTWVHERERDERWNRYRPIIVLTAATLLCLLLWWLSHR
jgi:curved DNA-binding protein CbpA